MEQRLTELPFRLFIEAVEDYAIFMLDSSGHVASWNSGAQRIKGYKADEIIGQHFSKFYTPPDIERKHPQFELKVASEKGRYEEEGWRVRKDGTRFWANVVITAIRDETGQLIGYGKVTRDLTERKRQEEREEELRAEQLARAQAEAASKAKSEFLTKISHELRTPLNAIIGYVDLLELGVQGPLTDDQTASLDRVRRSSQHLLALINDVLNVARAHAGGITYQLKSESAYEVMAGVEPLVLPQFKAHKVDFVHVDCDPAIRLICDRDKTQQVLLNLLTNAYKFTDAGGKVELRCEAVGNEVSFVVTDTGRGIDADKLAIIFEPFVQIDRHLSRESLQGVGLGLSISKDLARGMHGDLTVDSQPGVGSRFTLTLPRDNS
jgi:PAS domain S-box-containing protein